MSYSKELRLLLSHRADNTPIMTMTTTLGPIVLVSIVRFCSLQACKRTDANPPMYVTGLSCSHMRFGMAASTSTNKELFMRVRIDPDTHNPADEPEFVARGMMGDDFCIDENAAVAYVATHRQNTIDRVALEPSRNGNARHSVAGDPFTEQLIGPTKGAWGRGAGEYGRVAYFLTDGGTKSPPSDGIVRPSTVLRVEFQAQLA